MTAEEYAEKKAALIASIEAGDYHLSASSLKQFMLSPRHFIDYKLRPREETKAKRRGTLVHLLCLQPELFPTEYIIQPASIETPSSKQQKDFIDLALQANGSFDAVAAYRQCYSVEKKKDDDVKALADELFEKYKAFIEFMKMVEGREVVGEDMYRNAAIIAAALRNNAVTRRYLDRMTFFENKLEFEYAGINFLGYVDAMTEEDSGMIIDLKNLRDASPGYIRRQVLYDGIDVQLETYRIGTGLSTAICGVLAIEEPWYPSVSFVSESVLRLAHRKIDQAIFDFKRCIMEGAWDASYDFFSDRPEGEFAGTFLIA